MTQDPGLMIEAAQADAVARLIGPATERRRLLEQLALVDEVLRVRMAECAEVRVTHRRMAAITGMSVPAVGRWIAAGQAQREQERLQQ